MTSSITVIESCERNKRKSTVTVNKLGDKFDIHVCSAVKK